MHLWLRAEEDGQDGRTPLTPPGAASLVLAGLRVTVERSAHRCIGLDDYIAVGCDVAAQGSWSNAPPDAVILGINPMGDVPHALHHKHITALSAETPEAILDRARLGGGEVLNLGLAQSVEGQPLDSCKYWTGFVGMALTLSAWAAQVQNQNAPVVKPWDDRLDLLTDTRKALIGARSLVPSVLILGSSSRAGSGAAALCSAVSVSWVPWELPTRRAVDTNPALHAYPILVLAERLGAPSPDGPANLADQLVKVSPRQVRMVADTSIDVRPAHGVPLAPVHRMEAFPPLTVFGIGSLSSLLPHAASEDVSEQLAPALIALANGDMRPWQAAMPIEMRL
ncbi:MAG: hypothetical protein AAGF71_05710 [Pseudomonadota bacterium]